MTANEQINELYSVYDAGVKSLTIAGRESNFNEALKLLQELQLDTGEYYYDVGNTYYQLEQYPWALFYYLKARKMIPRDGEVKKNIQATLEKLELKSTIPRSWIPFSESEMIGAVQLLVLVTAILFSRRIWVEDAWLKFVSRVSLAVMTVGLLFLGFQYYLTAPQGVLAKAAILYKNPGTQFERVFLDPLPPGTVLEIIDEADEGNWTKTVNQDGVVGYVQSDKLLI
jgi:hypothetical protein